MANTRLALALFLLLEPLLSLTLLAVWTFFFFWLSRHFVRRLILLSSGGNILNTHWLGFNWDWVRLLYFDVSILSFYKCSVCRRNLFDLHFLSELHRFRTSSRTLRSISGISLSVGSIKWVDFRTF